MASENDLGFDARTAPPPLEGAALEAVRAALEEANIPTLLGALCDLTGSDEWLEPPYRPRPARGPDENDSGGLPGDVQAEIRERALAVVREVRVGTRRPAPPPSPERILRILSGVLGEELPDEMAGLLAEELGHESRDVAVPSGGRLGTHPHGVAIVGAGISGIGLAIRLRRTGIPFVILDRNPGIGGTWEENVYPGCGVDSPSHLYSFSFEQRATWSRYFVKQPELRAYLEGVVDDHDLRGSIRLRTEVVDATWSEDRQAWVLRIEGPDGARETLEAPVLVSAVGMMSGAARPDIPGLDDFEGPVMHSAEWDPDVDLTGRRVAVLGTGASAMQLVPALADVAERVTVFQRTPHWAMPYPTYRSAVPDAPKTLMHEIPRYLGWYRLRLVWNLDDRLHAGAQIDPDWPDRDRSVSAHNEKMRQFLTRHIETRLGGDPELVRQCVPAYPPYGKRMLLDNAWWDTLARDDVDVVSDRVAEVRRHGVVTSGGDDVEVDAIALATGFEILKFIGTFAVRGRGGGTLREAWGDDDARAHLGITVPGFPNFFVLFGPNTNAGHGGSQFMSAEIQIAYVLRMLAAMETGGLASVEPTREAFDAYNRELDEALAGTIWTHPGTSNYYRNRAGRIVANMPWTNADYRRRTREPDLGEYVTTPVTAHREPAAAP